MAKGKNDPTRENDYLEQLQWRSQHPRRWPVRFEPKWKYKIVYKPQSQRAQLANRIFALALLAGLVFIVITLIPSKITEDNVIAIIFFVGVALLITIIIFFAIRDGSKDEDNKSENSNQ